MNATTLTTTLAELNRLYGVYFEVAEKNKPYSQEAHRAWIEYEAYATRYQEEREL